MIQEKYQAGTAEYFEGELNRLRNSQLGKDEKTAIEKFLDNFQYNSKETPSFHRLYFHCNNLRSFALGMNGKFLDPTQDDIIQGLKKQKDRDLSEWTIEGYKSSIKKFYTWLGKKEAISLEALKYKNTKKVNYKRKSDFNITYDQVDLLIRGCDNSRDKAIISLLFDSGIRIGELITLKIKDIQIDESGLRAHVSGKTGERHILTVGDSVGYVKEWRNVHPDQFNPEAWLFCGLGNDVRRKGESVMTQPMNHPEVYAMFKRVKKRAVRLGFPDNVRMYPHKFRHAFATRMASRIQQPVLEKIMGWEKGTRMTGTYIHLNDEDVATAIYEANGLKAPVRKEMRKSKMCLKCKTFNPSANSYCMHCGTPLDPVEAMSMKQNIEKNAPRVTALLARTDLVSQESKTDLSRMSEEAKLEKLSLLLLDLEKSGQLEKLMQLAKALNQ